MHKIIEDIRTALKEPINVTKIMSEEGFLRHYEVLYRKTIALFDLVDAMVKSKPKHHREILSAMLGYEICGKDELIDYISFKTGEAFDPKETLRTLGSEEAFYQYLRRVAEPDFKDLVSWFDEVCE